MNPYDELGVPADADAAAINAAYRRRAHEVHPDKPGGDDDAFARLSRAVAVLRDPAARERFDRTGEIGDDAAPAPARGWAVDAPPADQHPHRSAAGDYMAWQVKEAVRRRGEDFGFFTVGHGL